MRIGSRRARDRWSRSDRRDLPPALSPHPKPARTSDPQRVLPPRREHSRQGRSTTRLRRLTQAWLCRRCLSRCCRTRPRRRPAAAPLSNEGGTGRTRVRFSEQLVPRPEPHRRRPVSDPTPISPAMGHVSPRPARMPSDDRGYARWESLVTSPLSLGRGERGGVVGGGSEPPVSRRKGGYSSRINAAYAHTR